MNNLPQPLLTALENQTKPRRGGRFDVTDFSTTTLIRPPLHTWIQANDPPPREDKDPLDAAAALYGTALHYWLEQQAELPFIAEVPVAVKLQGKTITSELDLVEIESATIYDYKLTKTWTVGKALEEGKKEWEEQLNIYRWLLVHNDIQLLPEEVETPLGAFEADHLKIVALVKDYGKEAKNKGIASIEVIDIPVWDLEVTGQYLNDKLAEHVKAKTERPRECTPEEKWQKGHYLLKIDGKLGKLKYSSKEKAEAKVASRKKQPKEWEIVPRLGEPLRCQSYCDYAVNCPYFQEF